MAQHKQRETIDAATQAHAGDEWQYGFRYVPFETPHGTTEYNLVPLTLDDALYPQEGDQVVHSDIHQRRCVYLYNVFRARLTTNTTATVLHDVLVRWETPDLRPNAPDVVVMTGVRERREWSSFDVAAEAARPALVIEVTSPHTRIHDLANKTDDYFDAGVPLYVIVDFSERRRTHTRRLLGYQTSLDGYVPIVPNERGWLWLEPVSLWLGIDGDNLVCYDQNEQPIDDYAELTEARIAAEARAAEAEQRVAALEAELQRLRSAA
ncbi:MAG: Uma2 family endonuclease [Roseiflexaceae bacterium]|nr:Uma2 family endonuclease [Roseiflexaceae bacterium]